MLREPVEFSRWIEQETAGDADAASVPTGLWIATPEGADLTLFEQADAWIRRRTAEWTVDPSDTEPIGRLVVAIGPEGGFSLGELEAAQRHALPRALLGENTLRVATAAAAAITAIRLAIRHAAS